MLAHTTEWSHLRTSAASENPAITSKIQMIFRDHRELLESAFRAAVEIDGPEMTLEELRQDRNGESA